MNRIFLILFLGLLSTTSVFARETVKGIVVDSKGEPIPGVKVEIPGSTDFTFTDLDGAFQILLRDPVKNLQFSYPGLGTTTHRVSPEMRVMLGKGWSGREKGFRGMLDLEGGMGVKGKTSIKSGNAEIRDIHTFLMTSPIVTLGYQLNRHIFIGAGTGAYLEFYKSESLDYNYVYSGVPLSGINIPIFVAARWDFGLTQKTAPYIGLRVGYSRFFGIDDGYINESYDSNGAGYSRIYAKRENAGSLFFMPSVGYHMTLHNKFGMNLGISYMAMMSTKLYAYTSSGYNPPNTNDWINASSESFFSHRGTDMIFFNIGFDF